jgi:hypothetical protein
MTCREWAQDPGGSSAFNLGPAMEPRELPEFRPAPTAEQAERQIGQGDRQLEILAALQKLPDAQATEAALGLFSGG